MTEGPLPPANASSGVPPQCPPTNTTGPEVTAKKQAQSAASQLQLKVIRTGVVNLKMERKETEDLINSLNEIIKELDRDIEHVGRMRDFAAKARLFQHGQLTQEEETEETPTPSNQPETCVIKEEPESDYEDIPIPGTSSGVYVPFQFKGSDILDDD